MSERAGIATWYNGIRFRSRLEARYASWFDRCGVRWDYEPFDLDGYIPDFVIGGTSIVEIKPALIHDELEPAIGKIWASGWMDGETPFAMAVGGSPDVAMAAFRWIDTGRPGRVTHRSSSWVVPYTDEDVSYRVDYEMNVWSVREPQAWNSPTLTAHWRDAGNSVQWQPLGPR